MADQHNDNIPAMGNQVIADLADMKENIEYHKDVFEAFVNAWDNTTPTNIKPKILGDADNDTLIQTEESTDEDTIRFDCGGTEVATFANGALSFNSVNSWFEHTSHSSMTSFTYTGLTYNRLYELDLKLYGATGDKILLTFNGDTAEDYDYHILYVGKYGGGSVENIRNGDSKANMQLSPLDLKFHSMKILFGTIVSVDEVLVSFMGTSYTNNNNSISIHGYGYKDLGDSALSSVTVQSEDGYSFSGRSVLKTLY